jgi:hypothetical protein
MKARRCLLLGEKAKKWGYCPVWFGKTGAYRLR